MYFLPFVVAQVLQTSPNIFRIRVAVRVSYVTRLNVAIPINPAVEASFFAARPEATTLNNIGISVRDCGGNSDSSKRDDLSELH